MRDYEVYPKRPWKPCMGCLRKIRWELARCYGCFAAFRARLEASRNGASHE